MIELSLLFTDHKPSPTHFPRPHTTKPQRTPCRRPRRLLTPSALIPTTYPELLAHKHPPGKLQFRSRIRSFARSQPSPHVDSGTLRGTQTVTPSAVSPAACAVTCWHPSPAPPPPTPPPAPPVSSPSERERPPGNKAGGAARSRRPRLSPVGRHAPPTGARAARPPRQGRLNGPSCGGGGGASLPSPRRAGARWSTRVRGWDGGAGRGPGTLGRGGARGRRLHNSSLPGSAPRAQQRAGRRAAPGGAGAGGPAPGGAPRPWSCGAGQVDRGSIALRQHHVSGGRGPASRTGSGPRWPGWGAVAGRAGVQPGGS